jgi:predicted nuclease of predicted toxin-antitoxin system
MEVATNEERTILTFDRDYGELIFRHNYRPPNGVIYLRLASYAPDEPGKLIDSLLKQNLPTENLLIVYDGQSLRQRAY